jgi:IS30 family transposase
MEKDIKKKLLTDQWSPQQIHGQAKLQGLRIVSHGRIYELIRQDKASGGALWKHTRHTLKHRKRPLNGKQITIKNKLSIELRPALVDWKERCGDREIEIPL